MNPREIYLRQCEETWNRLRDNRRDLEPFTAWQEYAAHYDEIHGATAPNKPSPRARIGRSDQNADAPIDPSRLIKIAHAHLLLAAQSEELPVGDRRLLAEAIRHLETLTSIWGTT